MIGTLKERKPSWKYGIVQKPEVFFFPIITNKIVSSDQISVKLF